MQRVDDYCVNCSMGCIHCGRKHVHHFTCDGRGCDADTLDGETVLYEDSGLHYCLRCLIERNLAVFIADMKEECENWARDNYNEVEDD